MNNKNIIFVPGKNPKPDPGPHRSMLWRCMIEGIKRSEPELVIDISNQFDSFKLIAWNFLYYHETKDISRDLPWIDALINKHGPSAENEQGLNVHRSYGYLVNPAVGYIIADWWRHA